jgi:hypothetical protein
MKLRKLKKLKKLKKSKKLKTFALLLGIPLRSFSGRKSIVLSFGFAAFVA